MNKQMFMIFFKLTRTSNIFKEQLTHGLRVSYFWYLLKEPKSSVKVYACLEKSDNRKYINIYDVGSGVI